jgi:hypothetical protein
MQGDGGGDELTPAGAMVGDVDPALLQDINFDDGGFCACNVMVTIFINSLK